MSQGLQKAICLNFSDLSTTQAGSHLREVDESLVSQLTAMGFSENGCRKACLAVKNAGVEQAMNWVTGCPLARLLGPTTRDRIPDT